MKRGSLVGPLLIILIGVWFLISSLRPDLPLLDLAAGYWPFVLIGWGALRLLEIVLWAVRGRPLPVTGLSGGEWTAIVFLCLIGSGLYAFNRHRPWRNWNVINSNEVFGHTYDFALPDQTAPSPKSPRIVIENLRGGVRVIGADVQEVKVSGRKSVRALQDSAADSAQKQTPVEISTQDSSVIVRTNQERVTGNQRVSTDLELTVPRSASLEIRGREGDVEVNDVSGGVDVSSDNASVRVQNIGGNLRLDLRKTDLVRATGVKGNVEVQSGRGRDIEIDTVAGEVVIGGSFSGDLDLRNCAKPLKFQSSHTDLRVEKLPGQIRLNLGEFTASNLVGPIRLTSNRHRDVHLEQFTQSIELSLDKGDITLRPMTTPAPKIDARTRSGQIEISIPEGAKFQLKAATNRGELENQYGAPLRIAYENDRRPDSGGAIEGSVGQGASIVLNTDRGGITVRKDSGAPPMPPRPPAPPTPPISLETERH